MEVSSRRGSARHTTELPVVSARWTASPSMPRDVMRRSACGIIHKNMGMSEAREGASKRRKGSPPVTVATSAIRDGDSLVRRTFRAAGGALRQGGRIVTTATCVSSQLDAPGRLS